MAGQTTPLCSPALSDHTEDDWEIIDAYSGEETPEHFDNATAKAPMTTSQPIVSATVKKTTEYDDTSRSTSPTPNMPGQSSVDSSAETSQHMTSPSNVTVQNATQYTCTPQKIQDFRRQLPAELQYNTCAQLYDVLMHYKGQQEHSRAYLVQQHNQIQQYHKMQMRHQTQLQQKMNQQLLDHRLRQQQLQYQYFQRHVRPQQLQTQHLGQQQQSHTAMKPVEKSASDCSASAVDEKDAKLSKTILYLRYQLQKGFLTKNQDSKTQGMAKMSKYIKQLEEIGGINSKILRYTKIHNVLKRITKLEYVPQDAEYSFKDRSKALLEKWKNILPTAVDGSDDSTASDPLRGTWIRPVNSAMSRRESS